MYSNKITLRSVFKFTRVHMEPAKNPATGRFADAVRTTNSLGDLILSDEDKKSNRFFIKDTDVIEIYDGKEFDLDDVVDAAWWDAIRFSKKIAQDRAQKDKDGQLIIDGNPKRYGTAEFFVERPGLESKVRNTRKRDIHEAKAHIYQDTPEGHLQKARLIGQNMTGLPLSDVEEYLVLIAEKTPHLITELYTGTDTHLRLLLLDGVDKGVIYNRDKLFYYGDNIILGATDSAVIHYFKNPANKRVVDMIKAELQPEYFSMPTVDVSEITEADIATAQPKRATTKK